jgi:hypothetical protein
MIASAVLIVLLTMGAESTRNMYSNLAVKNRDDCLKLHHFGYLMKCNFIVCHIFNEIRKINSGLKVVTFYCRILYLNYKTHLIIIRHVRRAQSSEMLYPIFS